MLSDVPGGPSGGQVACAGCAAVLDPLRAGHVAIFSARFHFFCGHACRARFLGSPEPELESAGRLRAVEVERAEQRSRAVASPVQAADAAPSTTAHMPARVASAPGDELIEPLATRTEGTPAAGLAPAAGLSPAATPRRDVGLLLVALTLLAGGLTMALDLAEPTRLVRVARLVLLSVGTCALVGRAATSRADPAKPHALVIVLSPLLATAVAVWALLSRDAALTQRAAFLGGTVVAVSAVCVWLIGFARRPVVASRRWVEERLDVPARRVPAEASHTTRAQLVYDLRPGEHLVVEAGEIVPVGMEVIEGDAEVVPWVAGTRTRMRAGDVVVAGCRVEKGYLRGVCTWAGGDRVLARSVLSPERRPDAHADIVRLGRRVAERWSLLVALAAGLVAALAVGESALGAALVAVAVHAAVGSLSVGSVAALSVARGVYGALLRGAIYRDAAAWEVCARVSAAVFCARGTLLRGEPELVDIEAVGDICPAEEVLALAAGALTSERHPVAYAVRRAAQQRGVIADAVRNPRSDPGRGVTAVASTGEAVCVGSRDLLLERRVSVAIADPQIYELESAGRTVLLVAKAGRLIGLLGLQDGLRAGARAAVQHLIDARVEPILISSDTRETCEALGRSLDIDHLRPEVLDQERGAVIERIRETGAVVAVLGHAPHDDDALRAADAAVALAAAGRSTDGYAVTTVTDDIRDGALALSLASATRSQATQLLALVLAPAGVGALAVTSGLLPPEFAPFAMLLGTMVAVRHLTASDQVT